MRFFKKMRQSSAGQRIHLNLSMILFCCSLFVLVTAQGCAYTVPVGKSEAGTVKKTEIDRLVESGDYKTDRPEDHGFKKEGFSLPHVEEKPACTAEVTPGAARNLANCK